MGWDSFGLPAENAAISHGIDSTEWTANNIHQMKTQIQKLLCDFDWKKELSTCEPEYYKWTQYIFLKLFEKGLAYQKWSDVDWDPVDKTVLAKEQVDANGISWRSGAKVVKKKLKQWFIKTTTFSKELYEGLDTDVDKENWRDVAEMQREWIGHPVQKPAVQDKVTDLKPIPSRHWGTYVTFPIDKKTMNDSNDYDNSISVFMPEPELLMYSHEDYIRAHLKNKLLKLGDVCDLAIVINSQHELYKPQFVDENKGENNHLVQDGSVKLKLKCSHPFSRHDFRIPIYVNDNLAAFSHSNSPSTDTNALLITRHLMPTEMRKHESCFLHTQLERDGAIHNFYEEYISPELIEKGIDTLIIRTESEARFEDKESVKTIRELVKKHLQNLGLGGSDCSSRLRDWLVSRQRRWGTPVPIIHCPDCKGRTEQFFATQGPGTTHLTTIPSYCSHVGIYPVPYERLPVLRDNNSKSGEVINCKCPVCHSDKAHYDTDTLDTFFDSSWYFNRFLDNDCLTHPFRSAATHPLLPVDMYVGGKEHATLHLYYARFMQHFLHSIGMVTKTPEPFKALLMMGQLTSDSYCLKETAVYVAPERVLVKKIGKLNILSDKETGKEIEKRHEKMSKSKYNGVNPIDFLEAYGGGVETVRLYMIAENAPQAQKPWPLALVNGKVKKDSILLNLEKFQNNLWLNVFQFRRQREEPKDFPAEKLAQQHSQEQNLYEAMNRFVTQLNFYFEGQSLHRVLKTIEIYCHDLRSYPLYLLSRSQMYQDALGYGLIALSTITPCFTSELWEGVRTSKSIAPILNNDYINHKYLSSLDWNSALLDQVWPKPDPEYLSQCSISFVKKDITYSYRFTIPIKEINALFNMHNASTTTTVEKKNSFEFTSLVWQHLLQGISSILDSNNNNNLEQDEDEQDEESVDGTKNRSKTLSEKNTRQKKPTLTEMLKYWVEIVLNTFPESRELLLAASNQTGEDAQENILFKPIESVDHIIFDSIFASDLEKFNIFKTIIFENYVKFRIIKDCTLNISFPKVSRKMLLTRFNDQLEGIREKNENSVILPLSEHQDEEVIKLKRAKRIFG